MGQEHGDRLDEKMDVVLIGTDFEKMHFVALGNFKTSRLNYLVYLFVYNYPAILSRTDKVIDKHRDVVTFVYVDAHACRVADFAASCGVLTLRENKCFQDEGTTPPPGGKIPANVKLIRSAGEEATLRDLRKLGRGGKPKWQTPHTPS